MNRKAGGWAKDSDLGKFFKKIALKKGRKAAISATARKIGVIIYHMVTKKEAYKSRTEYVFLDEKRRQLALIRKRITKFGIDPNEIGVFSRPSYKLPTKKGYLIINELVNVSQNKNTMKYSIITITLSILTCFSCGMNKNKTQTTETVKSTESKRVLDSILVVAKTHSLYRENVDWNVLEKGVYNKFTDSDTITSIIKPVQYMLTELGDFHGFLFLNGQRYTGNVKKVRNVNYDYQGQEYINKMSSIYQKTLNQDSIKGYIIKDKVAYIEIPMILPNGGNEDDIIEFTLKIRNKICELKAKRPIGWIVDLRGCLGGNFNPMLMGLAELMPLKVNLGGDSYDGTSISQEWRLEDGVLYYGRSSYSNIPTLSCQMQTEKNKIAVLIGRYTSSSGEAVASSLKGQDSIQLFGEQTGGATTSNSWIPIGKETVFNPAISYYVSKNKTVHKDGVSPDIHIDEDFDFENITSGKVFDAAKKWITDE